MPLVPQSFKSRSAKTFRIPRVGADVPIERPLAHGGASDMSESPRALATTRGRRAPDQSAVAADGGFEQLLAMLAMRFTRISPADVNATIVDSLHQIADVLDVDRSSWWHISPETGDAVLTHTWTRESCRTDRDASTHVPWMLEQLQCGGIAAFNTPDDIPHEADRNDVRDLGIKSGVAVPFIVNGRLSAALGFGTMRAFRIWSPPVIERLRFVVAVIGQVMLRRQAEVDLHRALAEMRELRSRLAIETIRTRRDPRVLGAPRIVVAESPATRAVLEQIESVAQTNATVLLLGETGTGKEVFAQAIHRASPVHMRNLVTVNCAAIPSALIESELFGRERGAYTGAMARQIGRFEMAHDSTIFLDEIGELPLEAQAKLLRVLQERVIERLGGGRPLQVNVRVIAATNRDLEKEVQDHAFREDLFYRLNVFPIRIPPLRERVGDIPALVWAFIEEYSIAYRKPIESIARDSMMALQRYPWPGNVRELRNVIERAVIVAKGPCLVIDPPSQRAPTGRRRLIDIEADEIRRVLEEVGWRVRGRGGAADLLGLKPNTLDSRMARLGIRRPTD